MKAENLDDTKRAYLQMVPRGVGTHIDVVAQELGHIGQGSGGVERRKTSLADLEE